MNHVTYSVVEKAYKVAENRLYDFFYNTDYNLMTTGGLAERVAKTAIDALLSAGIRVVQLEDIEDADTVLALAQHVSPSPRNQNIRALRLRLGAEE